MLDKKLSVDAILHRTAKDLQALATPEAVLALEAMVHSNIFRDNWQREWLVHVLGAIGSTEAVEALSRILFTYPNVDLCKEVLAVLHYLHSPEAIKVITSAFIHPNSEVEYAAYFFIARCGTAADVWKLEFVVRHHAANPRRAEEATAALVVLKERIKQVGEIKNVRV